jgi:hypothetical protein
MKAREYHALLQIHGTENGTQSQPEPAPEKGDKCGTYAGWNQHKREGTPVCDECRSAAAGYARKRRHRNGESKGTWVYVPDPHPHTADHYSI